MNQAASMRALGLAIFFASYSALAVGPAGAQQPSGTPRLQAQAEQIVGAVGGGWSVMAWSIDRNEALFAIHPHQIMVPASNNKIFTSIWALAALGPEHRFHTDLLITGSVDGDGVLQGDVVLRGSGDPGFGYPGFTPDPMVPLRKMARRLREHGVRAVEGRVVGDGSVFDTTLVGPAWPNDTGGGSAAYAPRVSGLAFQRNLLWIQLEPTRPGEPARVHLHPAVEEIPVVSTARTGGGRAWAVRHANNDTIQVRGAVAGLGSHRYGVGVADPAVLAAGALRRALLEAGISVPGPAVRGRAPRHATLLHRHVSLPLKTLIPKLNQESDNFFAEHLFKATIAHQAGLGSYERGGPASAVFFHERAGIPFGEMYQADGSGLSSHNRASANSLVRALVYAHEASWSNLFHESLAVAGQRGGTLSRMFTNTAAAGNLHAKTGFIRGVRGLSGYVRTRDGQLVAFSFLYNGSSTSGSRAVEQQLGALLANDQSSAPVVAEAGAGAGRRPVAQRP
ncbi:MAG: D-alanyl-D-alanine carboxypeptidase/D-alanyl-D-alanine-endopeptidase [Gemmatimonadetes bacterium]|nr:D-alanyl-D-alanine carboxypeptidase/D-alanyl-D-alanine-endopeptidase [Gemmatimonadota bacterium]